MSEPYLLATRSLGKLYELRPMFSAAGLDIIDLDAAGIAESSEEDGLEEFETFEENALSKANYFRAKSGLVTIADDSGLEVHWATRRACEPNDGAGERISKGARSMWRTTNFSCGSSGPRLIGVRGTCVWLRSSMKVEIAPSAVCRRERFSARREARADSDTIRCFCRLIWASPSLRPSAR